jgi:sec-independent protein translocase protein TatA
MTSMFITMGMIGGWEIAVIVLIVVLLFGARKIPELMKGAGRGIKEFKDAVNKDYSAENKPNNSADKAGSEE